MNRADHEFHQEDHEMPSFGSRLMKRAKYTALGLAFLGAITAINSFYILDQTEQAVITQFGKPVKVVINPINRDEEKINRLRESYSANEEGSIELDDSGAGLKVKLPYIQKVNRFDRRILEWDGYDEQIPTQDKKYLWVTTTARWEISDPLEFMRTVRDEH